ncbi:hypothetical protein [Actinocatenispora rupis]|uniref:Phage integrase family protein n=1 Tax=Actinocatenispora rupis TaxID=519421 RepID=A0A8J3J8Y6_9ACTN|nr:hypothetical protein Aru02nite_47800 [Actinocatenispora rupis]
MATGHAALLVDLDVRPRAVMQILRHADFAVTMEVYSQVSSTKTRSALKRLGDSLEAAGDGRKAG